MNTKIDLRTPREKKKAELDGRIVEQWKHYQYLLEQYSYTRVVNHIANEMGLSTAKVMKTIRQSGLWK